MSEKEKGVHLKKKGMLITIAIIILIFSMLLLFKPSKKTEKLEKEFENPTIEKVMELDIPSDYSELASTEEDWWLKYEELPNENEIYKEGGYTYTYSSKNNSQGEVDRDKLQEISDAKRSKIGFVANSTWKKEKGNLENNDNLEFLGFINKNYLEAKEELAVEKLELKQGSVIPAVTISRINSDLPGDIVAQVMEDVYDTKTGNYLLIPKGSKLFGSYLNDINFGQERIGVAWNRIIFPNSKSLNLLGMQGVQGSGEVGLKDKLNNHWGKVTQGLIFSSVLATSTSAISYASGDEEDITNYYQDVAGQTLAMDMASVGEKIIDRSLEIKPTIEIREGWKFLIMVNKDIILTEYEY